MKEPDKEYSVAVLSADVIRILHTAYNFNVEVQDIHERQKSRQQIDSLRVGKTACTTVKCLTLGQGCFDSANCG